MDTRLTPDVFQLRTLMLRIEDLTVSRLLDGARLAASGGSAAASAETRAAHERRLDGMVFQAHDKMRIAGGVQAAAGSAATRGVDVRA